MPGISYKSIGRWGGNGRQYENWAAGWGSDIRAAWAEGGIRAVFTVSSVPPDGGWGVAVAKAC